MTAKTRRPPRKYSRKQKDEACRLYVDQGLAEAHKQTGIPKTTIRSWAVDKRKLSTTKNQEQTKAATEERRVRLEEKRSVLQEKILDKANSILDRIDEPEDDFVGKDGRKITRKKPAASNVRDLVVAVGVLVDKFRLENGDAPPSNGNGKKEFSASDFDRFMERQVPGAWSS